MTGQYEYCKSHLAPHLKGWCTVRASHRVPLTAMTHTEAYEEVRALDWPIYQEGDRRRTWSMDGTVILDHGPRAEHHA